MGDLDNLDLDKLPPQVRNKLAQLELELSEGDVTEKGYHKKRNQLLKQYSNYAAVNQSSTVESKHKSRRHHRTTRTESRYHSEIRHEAVQQALSQWSKDSIAPKPMKRRPSAANGKLQAENMSADMFELMRQKTVVDLRSPTEQTLITYVSNCRSSDEDDTSTTLSSSVDEILNGRVGAELLTNVDGQIRLEIGEFGNIMSDSIIFTTGAISEPESQHPQSQESADTNFRATSDESPDSDNKPQSPLDFPSPPPRNHSINQKNTSLPSTSSLSEERTDDRKKNGAIHNQNRNSLLEPLKGQDEVNSVYANSELVQDEDYANTPLPLRQTRVSQKIQQLLLALQLRSGRPQATKQLQKFRHSLDTSVSNLIFNNASACYFTNENASLHNFELGRHSGHLVSAPDPSVNNETLQSGFQSLKAKSAQHPCQQTDLGSVNQLRLSNKNYLWPKRYSYHIPRQNRSRSALNQSRTVNGNQPQAISNSVCSLASQQRPNCSQRAKIAANPSVPHRIVSSDLHVSLHGRSSMLMLNRKHDYSQADHATPRRNSGMSILMRNGTDSKGLSCKSTKRTASSYELNNSATTKEPKEDSTTVLMSTYSKSVPFKHVNDIEDCSLVLDFFDPTRNDRRREAEEQLSRLQNDVAGFRSIQQQLKNYNFISAIWIGRRTTRTPLKNIENLEKIYSQLILHNYCQLQKPRKTPLQEFYCDYEDAELEAMSVEPSHRPEGPFISPSRGEIPLEFQASTPRSIETVLEKHSSSQSKTNAGSVLDQHGKVTASLTYGKLFSRSIKIAHMLKTKQTTVVTAGGHKEKIMICKPGDCVALVYPNTDPLSYLTAFYGCILAGVVPISVEIPTNVRDAGLQQFGFLLGSCGAQVALTTESCFKGLPKFGHSFSSSASVATSHTSSFNQNSASGSSKSGETVLPTEASTSATIPQAQHHPNDVIHFKGWPRLHWIVTENLSRPSRDFSLPSCLAPKSTAYIEYNTDIEGTVKGVCVSREAMLAHSKALSATMLYKENELLVCVLDFKKDVGFWHSILAAIYVGMRVVFVPYSVMKINPTVWMTFVSKNHSSSVILLKSRDLHWSLMASREQKDLQLEWVRAIVVADGANPWSLTSCDQFLATFKKFGLKQSMLCPCAGSPEVGTVSIRRPVVTTTANSGRGILSMAALSHLVVRVNNEMSLSSLAVQDAGKIIPGAQAIVIKLTGEPKLCKTDEVGEICLNSPSTGLSYFGLKGLTAQTFQVNPVSADGQKIGSTTYVRSGLVGFLGPCGLVFVIGNKTTMMNVSGRWHSADDLIATALSVEPTRFIYRGRIAVFSIKVLRDERICVVAEQKADTNEEAAFQWISRVLQAVESIHNVGLYCIALVPPNHLPKAALGGIYVSETRQRFLDGTLHPTTLLMCPQSCVLNLPKPREQQNNVGPAAMFVGNIVQGARIASACGRLLPYSGDEYLADILKQRAHQTPDHVLYSLVNSKGVEVETMTCGQLWKKAERIGALLLDKGHLSIGDHVALIFAPGLDLICAFYGCLIVGLVPVCIRAPSLHNLHNSLITVRMIVDVSKSVALLSTASMIKLLKSKEASHRVSTKAWPTILDINDTPSSSVARRRTESVDTKLQSTRSPNDTCYLDFAVSTTGQLAGIVVSASSATMQCKSLKMACELYPSRHLCLCLDPYSGLGFTLWTLASVYSGHRTTLIPPAEMEANPAIWFSIVSQHNIRDTFCSYSIMKICVRELAPYVNTLKEKGVNLACLRNLTVVAEERPRFMLCKTFVKLFAPLNLASRCVSTSFGSRTNTAICLQGASSPESGTVYVDVRALRHDRVALVEKGAPHSIPLMEVGALLPGVQVVIANPETKGQCADTKLGEIWVSSTHNATGYFSLFAEDAHLHTDHFNARLTTGDTRTTFARTGYLGFLRQTQAITADGHLHDAVFVVGALDETLMLRGLRYHPVDMESTVLRAHKRVCESAVFTWTHLLVVVAETDAPESEALDLVPAITSAILEEHHQIVGVIMLVDPHTIPINSRGEKQRMHLRDLFVKNDQLNPIYVAYNM